MIITAVNATPLFIPYKEPFYWGRGSIDGASVVLVEVVTDSGIAGYGECISSPSATGMQAYIAEATRLIIGHDPLRRVRIIEDSYRSMFEERGTGSSPRFGRQVLAGLEMALWDIAGKATGLAVHELLGGAVRDDIQYFGFPQGETPEQIARHAKKLAHEGYEVIYVKVGRGEHLDVMIVEQTREAIGPYRRLRLDANEQWGRLETLRLLPRLAAFDIEFIEQPLDQASPEALGSIREFGSIAIAADQSVFSPHDVYEICRTGAADLIVLGLHESGGISRFFEAAKIASAAGVDICIHGIHETGITTCAAHQAAAPLANLDDGNQYMNHLLAWDILEHPHLQLDSGRLPILSGPGLGFELDWDAVGRANELYKSSSV